MKKAVFGLAKSQEQADRLVKSLQDAGFKNNEISVLFSSEDAKNLAQSDEFKDFNKSEKREKKGTLAHEKHTKAPEGAATGAATGGVIGGAIGLLAGVGTLAVPGLGLFVAAGPIVAALSGSAVGGALGLLIGSFVGLGIPEYEAKKFESGLKSGGVLLCVHANDDEYADLAKDVLERGGAKDVATSREKAGTR